MSSEPMQHSNALPNTQSPLVKWMDQYGNAATIVACVSMIGGAIWFSYARSSASKNEVAWAQYSQARSAEEFGNIADVFSHTDVGIWARLGEAERLVDSGVSLMFTDREAALGDLKKADESFLKVLGIRSGSAVARERAAWGLAKSTEAQSDADTSKAIEGYTALLNQFPNSIYKAAAEGRIEALKSQESKDFYAWFHKQKPKPADLKKPKDGLPEGHPPLDSLLNDKPVSESGDDKKSDVKESDKPVEKKDADKPADDKKTDDKPADEKPKSDEKPADDLKKDDKPKADEPKKGEEPKSETKDKDAPADSK